MKTIIINSPKYGKHHVFVDDEDYEILSQITWCIHRDKRRKGVYAWTNFRVDGRHGVFKMHRFILRVFNPKILVDHIDGNGLNNQRSNLRLATPSQNNINKPGLNKTSKFKGVSWDRSRNKWRATIRGQKGWKQLGRFKNEIDAAIAYDKAAKEVHGEFAYLNKAI